MQHKAQLCDTIYETCARKLIFPTFPSTSSPFCQLEQPRQSLKKENCHRTKMECCMHFIFLNVIYLFLSQVLKLIELFSKLKRLSWLVFGKRNEEIIIDNMRGWIFNVYCVAINSFIKRWMHSVHYSQPP